jgi:hypothetical protein
VEWFLKGEEKRYNVWGNVTFLRKGEGNYYCTTKRGKKQK